MKRIVFILLIVGCFGAVNALGAELGKHYVIITPKKATLGELAEAYGKTQDEILALNPKIKTSGLIAGDPLLVPFFSDAYVAALEREKSGWKEIESGYLEEVARQEKVIKKFYEREYIHGYILIVLAVVSVFLLISRLQISRMRAKSARHYSLSIPQPKGYFSQQEEWARKRFGTTL